MGDTRQNLYLVGAALKHTRIDGVATMAQDAAEVALQHRGEFAERRNAAAEGAPPPLFPEPQRGRRRSVLPDTLQVVFQDVHDRRRPVGAQQLAQSHALRARPQRTLVAQQQPARALITRRADRTGPAALVKRLVSYTRTRSTPSSPYLATT